MEQVVMKMAILTLGVTLAMLKLSGGEEHQDNLTTTTLDDYIFEHFQVNLPQRIFRNVPSGLDPLEDNKMANEIVRYIHFIYRQTLLRYYKDFGGITTESIYKDLNEHCWEFLETPIKDLKDEPTNSTCVRTHLMKLLLSTLEKAADVTMEECPALCSQENLTICSTEGCGCALDHGQRYGLVLKKLVARDRGQRYLEIELRLNILNTIEWLLASNVVVVHAYFQAVKQSWVGISRIMLIAPSIELFGYENILNQADYNLFFLNANSNEESVWGVVRSNSGILDLPCSKHEEIYSRNSTEFERYYEKCDPLGVIESVDHLLRCVYKNSISVPLAWSRVTSIYVNSQCLCLAYMGEDCGVKAPLGVDDRTYCLSVLLSDFQRQVSFRSAATYLDYTFMTPIPFCIFTKLLQLAFNNYCYDKYNYSQPVICYFKDLLNKDINCTQRLILNTTNIASHCDTLFFTRLVSCEDGAEYNKPVFYYRLGDSTLVLTLTYVDLGLRLFTLVTYLACSQLRNLPGKLFIGYQLTALMRLVVVRAILEDFQLAVRLDVSMDLASTLWLTAYLHFVTHCINTLTPPDSLGVSEARMVLLRSSLIGCVLPAALSIAFFSMNEVLVGHVQVGQLLFVICNYVALLANLIMFYISFKVYYEIRRDVLQLQRNLTVRQVFADLFNFALKTSVMSGAGIIFRLVFTQIPGLVDVLSYYHALGTFHGLLLFLLYGCNREARLFWLSVWRSMQSRCHLGPNTSLRRNSLELQQRPI